MDTKQALQQLLDQGHTIEDLEDALNELAQDQAEAQEAEDEQDEDTIPDDLPNIEGTWAGFDDVGLYRTSVTQTDSEFWVVVSDTSEIGNDGQAAAIQNAKVQSWSEVQAMMPAGTELE